MAVPNILGVGVGLVDKGLVDLNFAALVAGTGFSNVDTITAHAGGTRAAGVPLTSMINHITVCATTADSVLLPAAVGGQVIVVRNDGAASTTMYAAIGTSDTINAVAAATGVAMAAAKTMVLFSVPAAWFGVLTA